MENISMLLEADELARKRIETETGTNFFVEASAGSGKTTALVKRMVALVESGVPVDKICAITFTKAAAREFYRRFQNELALRSTDPKVRKNRRDKCAEALKNINLCFTGTIDSFCNMLVSEHPMEAAVPVDASIRTDAELKKIYLREYRRAACGDYGPALLEKYRRFRTVHWDADGIFFDNIQAFMDTRSAKLCFDSPEDIGFDENDAEKHRIIELLRYIVEHQEDICYAGSGKAGMQRKAAVASVEKLLPVLDKNWSENIAEILGVLVYQKGEEDSGKRCVALTADLSDEFLLRFGDCIGTYIKEDVGKKGVLKHFLDLMFSGSPVRLLSELQHAVAVDFLDHFARGMADVLRSSGELSYFDYLLYLRNMLRTDAQKGGRLIKHIQKRHSCYLIDEFQDTNPLQAEVFFYLTAKKPDADWRRCVPKPGSLFIVGDPKQSIYRFRSADVSSFLRVKEMFGSGIGEVLQLHKNFRSTEKLCGWFNGIFSDMMPEETDIQSKYSVIPLEGGSAQPTGRLCGVYHYDSHKQNRSNDDAQMLVPVIKRLVGSPEHTIRGEKKGEIRPVRYGDIMVILPRKKSKLSSYLDALVRAGIPVYVEGETNFDSCTALVTAAHIMGAVVLRGDSAHLYAALRSPAFGVSEADLCRWKEKGCRLRLFPLPEGADACGPVYDALAALNELKNGIRGMTSSALLEYIAEKLELTVCCGSDNMEYLYYAIELLREAELSGQVCSQAQGAEFVAELVESSPQERCLSLRKSGDRVHLANLHKVKGLEAPVVILADPVLNTHEASQRVEYTGTEPTRWHFRLTGGAFGTTVTSTSGFGEEKLAEEESLGAERLRLMYVAATRARDALIVSRLVDNDGIPADSNPWSVFLPGAQPIDDVLAADACAAQVHNEVPDMDSVRRRAEEQCVFADRACEQTSYTLELPSHIRVPGQHADRDDSDDPTGAESISGNSRSEVARRHAAVLGTMVHRLMEVLVSSRGRADIDRLIEGMKLEYGLYSSEGGQLLELVREAAETVKNGGYPQQNEVPQDILSELLEADEVLCEVPFCLRCTDADGTKLTNGIIDLVYRKNGQWHIIDYKTSENKGDLDRRYASQLETYREAFRQLTGCDADARVYSIGV